MIDPMMQGALNHLAKHGGTPILRELAREVLAGRMTLRQAAASSAYSDALAGMTRSGLDRINKLSPEERAAMRDQGEAVDGAVRALREVGAIPPEDDDAAAR
jgi:hypothetical protein